ncbi:MAG: hypothetical protein OJF47_001803 [Nitrospira sp.]|jgi:hypothetical protein|nr:MAG: hypothetical protein OJF47_001803 [Nitrospira sp.]
MRTYFSIVGSVLWLCVGLAHAGSPEKPEMASWSKPVPETRLDSHRGGTDSGPLTINANFLNAKLNDNAAIDNVTGHNTITGNAFAGASGLPIVIQNSGNNVIIQSGTVLNLTIK